GWIVGEHGQILRTSDAGSNWVEEASPVKRSLMALSFPRPTAGWAAGEGGIIIAISSRPK
ncbi:MAG TPA: glycosyl hydrolase, partial [Nitrospira sp.]|nr:glycosyl hydrolase [Nitrospira sp.]